MTAATARVGRTERVRSHTVLPGPQLVVVGLDHGTAPIDLRERVASAESEIPAALADLTSPSLPLLEQAAILSTCNRVEVYGATRSRRAREEPSSFLARYHGLDLDELKDAVYFHRDAEVARHLGDVDSGPLVLIDLPTPRDIDPAAAGLAGVEVYTIDDLRPIVERTLSQRSAELPTAYSVVHAEVARFTDWLRRRETAADLRSLSIEIELARVGGEAGIRLPVRAPASRSCQ
jgi:glutamyl-tRNA reductase